ncbi:MAG: ABC transporter ATP-binding protein [Lachnospiraceae bacterium]|nr:ABC transporter ATP-binding protein [Lachnospiraceae bacterium]
MLYVKNLHKSYQSGNKSYNVLKGIDLSVADQEFVAVMGPSGSGKSTLLNCISCYIPFEQGTITLGGQELSGLDENGLAKIRNEKLGFVFQDFMLLDGLTMRENILVPGIIRGKADKKAEKLADQLLTLFGIEHIASKYPADVSGGERQRTAVARSLLNQPLLILADEPTGNLDSKSSRSVIESFENARTKLGASIFMVTHDSFAASFCDRVSLLKDGVVYDSLEAEPGHREGSRGAFQDRLLDAIRKMSSMES